MSSQRHSPGPCKAALPLTSLLRYAPLTFASTLAAVQAMHLFPASSLFLLHDAGGVLSNARFVLTPLPLPFASVLAAVQAQAVRFFFQFYQQFQQNVEMKYSSVLFFGLPLSQVLIQHQSHQHVTNVSLLFVMNMPLTACQGLVVF